MDKESTPTGDSGPPRLLAMALARYVHQDSQSKRFTIVNTICHTVANDFPIDVDFYVYLALADRAGRVPMCVRVLDDGGDAVAESALVASFPPLSDVCEVATRVVARQIAGPGVYSVQALWEEQVLAERQLTVHGDGC